MMNFRNLIPKQDQRAIIIGTTGCGKTTLARYLLSWLPYVVVYDTKGCIRWDNFYTVRSFQELQSVQTEYTHLHYIPTLEESRDTQAIDAFFQWVYLRGNCVLYVDELSYVCDSTTPPFWLSSILMRGRELGIGFIGSTQRPKRIPLVLFSEADNWFCFKLRLDEDAERVEKTLGVDREEIKQLPNHHFYYGGYDSLHPKPIKLEI